MLRRVLALVLRVLRVLRVLWVLRRVALRLLRRGVLPWLLLVSLRRVGRLEAALLLLLSREARGLL